MTDPIVKTIEVACSANEAFDIFVHNTTAWWPLGGHSVSAGSGAVAQALTIEPRIGGAVYETMHNGQRSEWGKVLSFDAGRGFSMTWHPGASADQSTEVSVTFDDVPEGRCRVQLTHSNWENLGAKAEDMRGSYNGGWVRVFEEHFARACV